MSSISKLTGTLLYVQVQEPIDCFVKEKGKEWKASIAVDEDQADAWNEIYTKQTATVVKTAEFEDKYKTPAPFPNAKKQYVITLRKNTKLGNGKDVPELYQPKVLVPGKDGYKDVTREVLVGNGSKGAISVDTWEMTLGSVARLKNILVEELVEYQRPEGSGEAYNPGDEFSGKANPPRKSESKQIAAKLKSKPAEAEEDDSPF